MNDEIDLNVKFCHPSVSLTLNVNGCNESILKIPQSELVKFQVVEFQNKLQLGEFDMGLFSYGLGLVLMFYILSYGLGQIIKIVR